jgi:phosphoribosylformylglycinamidine (FGAM) synthase-like enzyme
LENAKKAGDTIADVQKQIREFGMSETEKKFDALKSLGLDAATLKQARNAFDQLEAMQNAKKVAEEQQREGKSIFEATRTPMEKYTQQINHLHELLDNGAINWNTYGRAVREARKQLEDAGKASGPQMLEAGSAAAQRFAFDASKGQRDLDANRDDLAKGQFDEQRRSRQVLERIETKLITQTDDQAQVVELA